MCKINFKKVEPPKAVEIKPPVSYQESEPLQNEKKYGNIEFTDLEFPQKTEFPDLVDLNAIPLLPVQSYEEEVEISQIEAELQYPPQFTQQTYPSYFHDPSPTLTIPIPPYNTSTYDSSYQSYSSEENSSPPYQPAPFQAPKQNIQFIPSDISESLKKKSPPTPTNAMPPKKKVKTENCTQQVQQQQTLAPKQKVCKAVDEKRERNRLAAEKYRKKGRDTIANLEVICKQLSTENSQLKDKSAMLEQQVQQLKTVLFQYGVSKELLDSLSVGLN